MLIEDKWIIMRTITTILGPFEMVTTLLSSESKPISMVMPPLL